MEFLDKWQEPLLWASALSLVMLVASLVGIPWVITRLPHDYFSREDRVAWNALPRHPALRLLTASLKNLLGLVLVILGLVMLVTPGQGLLTLFVGLLLMNFPGKYHLERWLILHRSICRSLNWLRRRLGKLPFDRPPRYTGDD